MLPCKFQQAGGILWHETLKFKSSFRKFITKKQQQQKKYYKFQLGLLLEKLIHKSIAFVQNLFNFNTNSQAIGTEMRTHNGPITLQAFNLNFKYKYINEKNVYK